MDGDCIKEDNNNIEITEMATFDSINDEILIKI